MFRKWEQVEVLVDVLRGLMLPRQKKLSTICQRLRCATDRPSCVFGASDEVLQILLSREHESLCVCLVHLGSLLCCLFRSVEVVTESPFASVSTQWAHCRIKCFFFQRNRLLSKHRQVLQGRPHGSGRPPLQQRSLCSLCFNDTKTNKRRKQQKYTTCFIFSVAQTRKTHRSKTVSALVSIWQQAYVPHLIK